MFLALCYMEVRLGQLKRKMMRNDARMARWMCNDRLEDRISTEECLTRLKLNSMKENV